MKTNSSRAERMRCLLEDSKDDSSREDQPSWSCPFDLPSTNENENFLKEDYCCESKKASPNLRVPRPGGIDESNRAAVEVLNATLSVSSIVRSVNQGSNINAINEWIQAVDEVHVHATSSYQNELPNVEDLMQPWPKEMKDLLNSGEVFLPPSDIDLSLEEYARTLCSLFDIPVKERLIDGIRALISLFVEYKDYETGKNITNLDISEWR